MVSPVLLVEKLSIGVFDFKLTQVGAVRMMNTSDPETGQYYCLWCILKGVHWNPTLIWPCHW